MGDFKKNYKKVFFDSAFCADGNGWLKFNVAGIAVLTTMLLCGFALGLLAGVEICLSAFT